MSDPKYRRWNRRWNMVAPRWESGDGFDEIALVDTLLDAKDLIYQVSRISFRLDRRPIDIEKVG